MYLLFHEFDREEGGKRLVIPVKIWATEILYYSRADNDRSRCKLWLFGMGQWMDFEESYEQADEIITQAQKELTKANNSQSSKSSDDELDDDDIV